MARAFVVHRFRLVRVRILLGLFYLCMTILLLSGMDPDFRLRVRIAWALLLALVPLGVIVVAGAVLVYVVGQRNVGRRLVEGSILESGFGEDALVIKSPWSESRIRYSGITSVERRGDFVFLRQVGMPVVNVFPAPVFPDEAIARIRAAAR
jgi:hypothetical protein